MKQELISFDRLTLIRDGIRYLDQVSFQIYKSEVIGFLNVNHHGQEELIQVLRNNIPIHYGKLSINRKVVNHYQTSDGSFNEQVHIIEESSKLIEGFSVSESFSLFSRGNPFVIDQKKNLESFQRLIEGRGIQFSGEELVENLSAFERYFLEIIRAVYLGAELVVIRDISNYVSANELLRIFQLIRTYKSEGISFAYVCNHHQELFQICDRVTLWEDGHISKVIYPQDYNDDFMLNYSFDFATLPKGKRKDDTNYLSFDIVNHKQIKNLSFTAKKGDCVTILDQENIVFDDLVELLIKHKHALNRHVSLIGKRTLTSEDTMLIPADPTSKLLVDAFSFTDNLMFDLNRRNRRTWLKSKDVDRILTTYSDELNSYYSILDIDDLKKSEKYMLIYFKVMVYNPKIVILVQPFSGADMYLRQDILNLINKLKEKGITVLILALSLSDALFVSDKLVLVNNGQVESILLSEDFSLLNK